MNQHTEFEDLLLLYAADADIRADADIADADIRGGGRLSTAERNAVEEHLRACDVCRADLHLWQAVANEIRAHNTEIRMPDHLADRALAQIHARPSLQTAFLRAWQLLKAQALLIQYEVWPASAVVMLIGVVVALLAEKVGVIRFLAPLVAAASLAVIYGPEHDPATELALTTPTSPWKILLARLTLVSSYNLLLTLLASLALLTLIPPAMFGTLILEWLGPLTFLSALALLLSLWMHTSNAVTIVCSLWFIQYLYSSQFLGMWNMPAGWQVGFSAYQQFWEMPGLLLLLSSLLFGAALVSVQWPVGRAIKP
ncbi:MAG: hypothetical protein JXA33_01460 [Anaerolineae bacterium]|nr:hypothetical protein [Anaerolineae bacterium]